VLNCHAEELLVNSLAQNCWYQNQNIEKGIVKISSFPEHEAISMPYELLVSSLLTLVPSENKDLQSLHLHCGSYGASIVAKVKSESGNFCLWAMLEHGKIKTRTLGGTLETDKSGSKLCDGYKQGELLVALKNKDFIDQVRSEKWSAVISEIIPVAFNIYKIKLTSEYYLREMEVAKMFQESFGVAGVTVELNQYQHGIGEYAQLK
jgi:hypothetical protein